MLTINKKQAGVVANAQYGAVDTEITYVAISGASDFVTVGAASAQFAGIGAALAAGQIWRLSASTDLYYAQGANPTATAGAGSEFVAKGVQVYLDGGQGVKLAVLQASVAGTATLTRCDG